MAVKSKKRVVKVAGASNIRSMETDWMGLRMSISSAYTKELTAAKKDVVARKKMVAGLSKSKKTVGGKLKKAKDLLVKNAGPATKSAVKKIDKELSGVTANLKKERPALAAARGNQKELQVAMQRFSKIDKVITKAEVLLAKPAKKRKPRKKKKLVAE